MTLTSRNVPTRAIRVGDTDFAYRRLGPASGTPIVLLHHLTGVLDEWDPNLLDGLAQRFPVIAFDNRGVGKSGGRTPTSVESMAEDAVAFMTALELERVHLLGFSLGGFVAQAILQRHPGLVSRAILSGTAPAGSADLSGEGKVLERAFASARAAGKHPKHFLFFTQSSQGQDAADRFLARLAERTEDLDLPVSDATVAAQLAAIAGWGRGSASDLRSVAIPTFIANGDSDVMVPTRGSFELMQAITGASLSIYPDAGHGGIFQYGALFLQQALAFLTASSTRP